VDGGDFGVRLRREERVEVVSRLAFLDLPDRRPVGPDAGEAGEGIGLDQSNRLPVLDLLADKFKDWQVVLLTHDRVWFEMARAYHRRHKADKFWRYAKIHSNDDPTQASRER
jgi:hypothetical protein